MRVQPLLAPLLLVALATCAQAQIPDVRVNLDATLSYRSMRGSSEYIRAFGYDGRFSLVSLSFTLEPGMHAFVSERLQRIPGDGDPDLLDEYYVEDRGIWRLGKQVIPFGSERIVRESVPAARADTNLLIQGLPSTVALMDAGTDRQRGVVARIGSRIGLSVFFGQHLGIDAPSFTLIRHPEDAPGVGRGYSRGLDVDGARRFGKFEVRGEFVAVSDGATPADHDINLADISVSFVPSKVTTLTAGYTSVAQAGGRFTRLGGAIPIVHGVQLESWVRFKDSEFWDLSAQVRVRL